MEIYKSTSLIESLLNETITVEVLYSLYIKSSGNPVLISNISNYRHFEVFLKHAEAYIIRYLLMDKLDISFESKSWTPAEIYYFGTETSGYFINYLLCSLENKDENSEIRYIISIPKDFPYILDETTNEILLPRGCIYEVIKDLGKTRHIRITSIRPAFPRII